MATLAALASTVLVGCVAEDSPSTTSAPADEVVFSEAPPAWFDAYFATLNVARDGSGALISRARLVDLSTGAASPIRVIDTPMAATFDETGRVVVGGRQGAESGWFRAGEGGGSLVRLEDVPTSALPVWSSSGRWIAYVSRSAQDSTVRIADAAGGELTPYQLPGPVQAAAWVPGDTTLLVLLSGEHGLTSLRALDRASGRVRMIADGLDGPYVPPNLAVSGDARFAYVALASAGAPDPEDRHVPDADRDLDIYRIDLASGEREPIVQTPAEELAPAIGGGSLYWVSIETLMEAVIVPAQGGQARVVAGNVQLPTWRPDGRALGVTTGNWRLADWALNLDGGVVAIDADGNATGPVAPIVTGYHEDFSPVWSPDGNWIAYHSHRSLSPVAAYEDQGSADDIFLRRPDASASGEIRLTDFGWEVGSPDWAPDGRRLVMDSWNRSVDAVERTSVWIVEIDPETGAFAGRTRLPLPPEARGTAMWEAWSPSREEIAVVFAVRARAASENEIWVIPLDGASARRVITYTGHVYGGVDWSADGNALIYPAIEEDVQQLFSVPRSGGEPRKLTMEATSLFHPQASPDGRWVAASRIRSVSRVLRRPLSDRGS